MLQSPRVPKFQTNLSFSFPFVEQGVCSKWVTGSVACGHNSFEVPAGTTGAEG